MEQVKTALSKAVADLEHPTKENPVSTLALEKLSQFQTLNDPQLELMKTETARFITAWKRGDAPRWLSLVGTSGSGKTMLARKIRDICGGEFITWTRITNYLREGEYRWFQDLIREELLIVDDIGAEHQTGFVAAKLYELLSERIGKWTVLTANLSLENIGNKLDPRIASRMIRDGSVVVDVDVLDFNLRGLPVPEA
jgi:DNA replication protein DnaC